MDEPPSKTLSCFPENEVDNSTKFRYTQLPGLENNDVSPVDSSHNDHYLHVEVEDSGIIGQEGAIENVSTSSADVGVAENMELETPASVPNPLTTGAKTVEEHGAKKSTSIRSVSIAIPELEHERVIVNKKELSPEDSSTDRSNVLDLYTLEAEGGSSIRGRQGRVESSGKGNIIAK